MSWTLGLCGRVMVSSCPLIRLVACVRSWREVGGGCTRPRSSTLVVRDDLSASAMATDASPWVITGCMALARSEAISEVKPFLVNHTHRMVGDVRLRSSPSWRGCHSC